MTMKNELIKANFVLDVLARNARLRKHNIRNMSRVVREVRGVFGFHCPEHGRLDVLGQRRLSPLIHDLNNVLEDFSGNERLSQPIAILEFNGQLPDQNSNGLSKSKITNVQVNGDTSAETELWEESDSFGLFEARYESEKLLFRGIYGDHKIGVGKKEQKLLEKLHSKMAQVTKRFSDSDWLRLDHVTVLFNPVEVRTVTLRTSEHNGELNNPEAAQFQPKSPAFAWGDVVLSPDAEQKLDDLLYEIQNKDELLEHRYQDVYASSAFLLALNGPAGTGKTTLASGIADRLGKKIIVLSYAAIENALVGEAAKTLKRVFQIAKENDAVLFIDEADSLASHRPTSFSQGTDYHISSLRSELFTEISKFDGVLIVATNNAQSYDKAFVSRIYENIEMGLPDERLREALWQRYLPLKVAKTDKIPWQSLVEISKGISGRDIAKLAKRASNKAHRRGRDAAVILEDVSSLIDDFKEEEARRRQNSRPPKFEGISVKKLEKPLGDSSSCLTESESSNA